MTPFLKGAFTSEQVSSAFIYQGFRDPGSSQKLPKEIKRFLKMISDAGALGLFNVRDRGCSVKGRILFLSFPIQKDQGLRCFKSRCHLLCSRTGGEAPCDLSDGFTRPAQYPLDERVHITDQGDDPIREAEGHHLEGLKLPGILLTPLCPCFGYLPPMLCRSVTQYMCYMCWVRSKQTSSMRLLLRLLVHYLQ